MERRNCTLMPSSAAYCTECGHQISDGYAIKWAVNAYIHESCLGE